MPRRLSLRIALLILIGIPLNFFLFININFVVASLLGLGDSAVANIVQVGLLIISTPLLLGFLASRYVTRPLQKFTLAIESLKQNSYHTRLEPSGIQEFDQVFETFNRLTRRLADEEELRKSLISDTSHELNTPLSAMLSQLTAMEDQVLPITPERIAGLKQQTERLVELIAHLDEYTRARVASTFQHKTALPLLELCIGLEHSFAALLAQHQMRLRLDITPEYVLYADRSTLERILTNLLQNALRYSHGSLVTIAANGEYLLVSDDGQGVAAEHLPRLFERFYRVDASRSRDTGGLGLGLSIVAELAASQGWQVRAEDGRPGLQIRFILDDQRRSDGYSRPLSRI